MNCPTCGYTMVTLGHAILNCRRCGTVRHASGGILVPEIVTKMREFTEKGEHVKVYIYMKNDLGIPE